MSERWLPVVGYEGLYEVSDLGRVRGVERFAESRWPDSPMRIRGQILAPGTTQTGHPMVRLCRGGRGKSFTVHRLVLIAFVGPAPPGLQCCHKDGVPTNNHLSNLRWDTPSANVYDQVRHGTHQAARKTHCKYGHELVAPNLYIYGNKRKCRTCTLNQTRRDRLSRRAAS